MRAVFHGGTRPAPFTRRQAVDSGAYRKKAITAAARRSLAERYGCPPGGRVDVPCHYCGAVGFIRWWALSNGRPSGWVSFGHEIDHVYPESLGGSGEVDNLVLACQRCNRRKGARMRHGA